MKTKTLIPLIVGISFILVVTYLSAADKIQLFDFFKQSNSFSIQETENSDESEELEMQITEPSNVEEIQGMKIEILKEGQGNEAKNGDIVTVHYVGTFEDGTKFDSSVDRGRPFSFTLGVGQVIEGWDLGVLGMKVGEKRKLTIPSDLAYGSGGVPGAIPPDSTLIFEVELLGIYQ